MAAASLAIGLTGPLHAQFDIELLTIVDISHLNLGSVGGLAFDNATGHLWVADATAGNMVFEIDPFTGNVFSTLDPSVLVNFTGGPDAMALDPTTGNIAVFDSFNSLQPSGLLTQTGAVVVDWDFADHTGGAFFDDQGNLYTVSGWHDDDGSLRLIDLGSGDTLSSVAINPPTARLSAMDLDPVSGHVFAYEAGMARIIEIDPVTGNQLGSTSMAGVMTGDFPTGLAFDDQGQYLFASKGSWHSDELFIFERLGPVGTSFCVANANSTGSPTAITSTGSTSVQLASLTLHAEPIPNDTYQFFSGPMQVQVPFGDGFRCAGGTVTRIDLPRVASTGSASVALDFGVLGISPGTLNFQCWYRDPAAAASGFNSSDGLSVTFVP